MLPVASALGVLGTVHVIELPGHGETPLAFGDTFSIATFARALAAGVASLGAQAPLAFGYSMGGYVALALEASAPATFAAIATLGTKFAWTPESAERETLRLNPGLIAEKIPRFAATLAARHERVGGWEHVVDRTAAMMRDEGKAPTLTSAVLSHIHVPVAMAVGADDDTVSAEETRSAASAVHRSASIWDDVGHPIERVPVGRIVTLVQALLDRRAQ